MGGAAPEKKPEWIRAHVDGVQLRPLMNAAETLAAAVIRKLAVITHQAERPHLPQPGESGAERPRPRRSLSPVTAARKRD